MVSARHDVVDRPTGAVAVLYVAAIGINHVGKPQVAGHPLGRAVVIHVLYAGRAAGVYRAVVRLPFLDEVAPATVSLGNLLSTVSTPSTRP